MIDSKKLNSADSVNRSRLYGKKQGKYLQIGQEIRWLQNIQEKVYDDKHIDMAGLCELSSS